MQLVSRIPRPPLSRGRILAFLFAVLALLHARDFFIGDTIDGEDGDADEIEGEELMEDVDDDTPEGKFRAERVGVKRHMFSNISQRLKHTVFQEAVFDRRRDNHRMACDKFWKPGDNSESDKDKDKEEESEGEEKAEEEEEEEEEEKVRKLDPGLHWNYEFKIAYCKNLEVSSDSAWIGNFFSLVSFFKKITQLPPYKSDESTHTPFTGS